MRRSAASDQPSAGGGHRHVISRSVANAAECRRPRGGAGGSGGGGYLIDSSGGSGGGALSVEANGTLQLDASLHAIGGTGATGSGGGSGGAIKLSANHLILTKNSHLVG